VQDFYLMCSPDDEDKGGDTVHALDVVDFRTGVDYREGRGRYSADEIREHVVIRVVGVPVTTDLFAVRRFMEEEHDGGLGDIYRRRRGFSKGLGKAHTIARIKAVAPTAGGRAEKYTKRGVWQPRNLTATLNWEMFLGLLWDVVEDRQPTAEEVVS